MFGWCWNKKLWQCNTQAASTVFPLRDVRSAGGAGAWGLPHWQREHYRCRTSSSFKAIVLILKVVAGFHLNDKTRSLWSVKSAMMPTNKNTVSLNAHERISQNLSTFPPIAWRASNATFGDIPVKICFCILFRCDGVHGEGGGLHHFVLKERDVQFLQGPTPNSRAWFLFLQSTNFLVVAFTIHCKCRTC